MLMAIWVFPMIQVIKSPTLIFCVDFREADCTALYAHSDTSLKGLTAVFQ